ncbi:MAG: FISUMP domain-containing protein [Bacteroidota bacterium]|nr:FISUMP domain-containing protein [Bacteroidota bacterium]
MKKTILFLTLLLSFGILYSQLPQAFKYQAIARDENDELIINQTVKIKLKILQSSTSGTIIFSEIHNILTNNFGLIDLEIGTGSIESGNFSAIDWSASAFFLRAEMDVTGGTNFSHMGTRQLLSVTYALYAETSGNTTQEQGIISYTQSEIDNLSPNPGDMVYNLTTNCMNFFNGSSWVGLSGDEDCILLPSTADAGSDQFVYGSTTILEGNIPQEGIGVWSVLSGTGNYVINEPGNASSLFSGENNETYTLAWTISTFCESSTDLVEIEFTNCDDGILCTYDYFSNAVCHHDPIVPTVADAGPNQEVFGDSTTLEANVAIIGSGSWSVSSGTGWSISNINNPKATFSGITAVEYVLVWVINDICGTTSDNVTISFFNCDDGDACTDDYYNQQNNTCYHDTIFPTTANAGSDQIVNGNSTTLAANEAIIGTGSWSVISGINPMFSNPNDRQATFSGNDNTVYELVWTIDNNCSTSSDAVEIDFFNCDDGDACTDDYYNQQNNTCYHDTIFPTTANAGSDQIVNGNSTTLAANEAIIGTGSWSVISGINPMFSNPNDRQATFSGNDNTVYELVWTIDNNCSTSSDAVEIDFFNCDDGDPCTEDIYDQQNNTCYNNPIIPTVADAGQDQTNAGSPAGLQANTALVGNGYWTIYSGEGGVIIDSLNPQSDFTGSTGIAYILVWTIQHNCDTTSDIVVITFGNTFICGINDLIDSRDSQAYGTVQIGNQCWMTENLNYGVYGAASNGQSNNSIAEKYCYDNILANCNSLGGLYTWDELMQYSTAEYALGLCDTGWHVPSDTEWYELENYIDSTINNPTATGFRGTDARAKLMTGGSSGLEIIYSGIYYEPGAVFYGASQFATKFGNFASSTESTSTVWIRSFHETQNGIERIIKDKLWGNAVRCIKNAGSQFFAPELTSFTLDSAANVTTDKTVALVQEFLYGPVEFIVSENSSFSGSSWQLIASLGNLDLSRGNGEKTVYLKLRNTYGVSNVLNDSITLDIPVPTVAIDSIRNAEGIYDIIVHSTITEAVEMKVANTVQSLGSGEVDWNVITAIAVNENYQLTSPEGDRRIHLQVISYGNDTAVTNFDVVVETAPIGNSIAARWNAESEEIETQHSLKDLTGVTHDEQGGRCYKCDNNEVAASTVNYNGDDYLHWEVDLKKPANKVAQISQEGSGTYDFFVCWRDDGFLFFQIGSAYGGLSHNVANTLVHYKVIFDGQETGNSNRLKIWLDGSAQTLTFNGTIPSALPASSRVVKIGKNAYTTPDFKAANLAMYNRLGNLIHLFNCDEQNGIDIFDCVGSGSGIISDVDIHEADNDFPAIADIYGYTEDAVVSDRIIPIAVDSDGHRTEMDINGNTPTYLGKIGVNMKIVKNPCVTGGNSNKVSFDFADVANITNVKIRYSDGSTWQTVENTVSGGCTVTGLWRLSGSQFDILFDGSTYFTGKISELICTDNSNIAIIHSNFSETTGFVVYNRASTASNKNGLAVNFTASSFVTADEAYPVAMLDGYDLWQFDYDLSKYVYVPYHINGTSLLSKGDTLQAYSWVSTHLPISSHTVHNGATSKLKVYDNSDLLAKDTDHVLSDGLGTIYELSLADLQYADMNPLFFKFGNHFIKDLVLYTDTLSGNDLNTATTFFGVTEKNNFVFEGDSHSNGYLQKDGWDYPSQFFRKYEKRHQEVNLAGPGRTAHQIMLSVSTINGYYDSSKERNILMLMAGSSDVANGVDAQTIYNNLKIIWASCKSTGFEVVATTILPTPLVQSVIDELNVLIKSDSSLYDYLVDTSLNSDIGVAGAATGPYFLPDHTHLTEEGAGILAELFYNLIH